MGTTVLDHDGPFTERDFLDLASRSGHVELVEGSLLVGPAPGPAHVAAVAAVRQAVTTSLPEGLRVVGQVPLRLGPDCVLVPDLVVARAEQAQDREGDAANGGDPAEVLDCADVLIVVDVVDRTHGIAQRSFVPQLYARSGIPYAVLVDVDGPVGVASMLIGGRYHEFSRAGAGERLQLEEPYRVEIDLAALAGETAAHDQ